MIIDDKLLSKFYQPLFLSSRGLDKLSLVTFPPLVVLVKFVPAIGPQLMHAFPFLVAF